jgi:hypothetical protein
VLLERPALPVGMAQHPCPVPEHPRRHLPPQVGQRLRILSAHTDQPKNLAAEAQMAVERKRFVIVR